MSFKMLGFKCWMVRDLSLPGSFTHGIYLDCWRFSQQCHFLATLRVPRKPTLCPCHVWTTAAKLLPFFCQMRRSVAFCGATFHNNKACVKIAHFLDSVNLMRPWNLSHSSANKYFSGIKLIGNRFFLFSFSFLFSKIPGNGERRIVMTETDDNIKNWEF